MAKLVFQVLRSLIHLGRSSLMGENVSRWSQSALFTITVGSENLYYMYMYYGLIQYQWPEHRLAFMAQPVFQVLMCLLVPGRASLMGETVSKWNQSSLCATIVG